MPRKNPSPAVLNHSADPIDREALVALLNQDLAREYQAIIAYVVYSQVLKGAAFMAIAQELETHAAEELQHALVIAQQIDYLGGTPAVVPKPVKLSSDPKALLRFDLQNETETIRQYRDRVAQCEALGESGLPRPTLPPPSLERHFRGPKLQGTCRSRAAPSRGV
ncbi:MAG TPA: ferritin-like domain-containing protein [Gemmatimonadales bacterium]